MESAKQHVRTTQKTLIEALGMDEREVVEWRTYAAMETKKITIKVYGTNSVVHEIQIEGDRSQADLVTVIHFKFDIPIRDSIRVKRVDDKPFWVDDRGQYSFITQHHLDKDTRPSL
jgi:hypothetical protein